MERSFSKKILIGSLVLLLLSLAGNGYLFMKVRALGADPQVVAREESVRLVNEVGKLIALPPDEEPTIATVTDPDQLKDQVFFANAQKGYKVLLYANAKKAILYDPINKRIIEVAPINIGTPPATPATP
ncbi:MAG: hypothetical protein WC802_04820 [Patescibacteria group bacterium]|jgi:hypothetical protein